ncbi:uncharacterized protein LOC111111067 [Crassostrea virginica]
MLEPPLAMVMIGVCLIWPFLSIAVTSISIEITNTLKGDCENGYIEFRCVVEHSRSWVVEVFSISLIKNYVENVVSVSKDGVLDDTLANRSGVAINSSFRQSNVGISYLIIRIMASEVKPEKDKGLYGCGTIAIAASIGRFKGIAGGEKMLNITDLDCSKQSSKNTYKTAGDFDKGMYITKSVVAIGMCDFLFVCMMVFVLLVYFSLIRKRRHSFVCACLINYFDI